MLHGHGHHQKREFPALVSTFFFLNRASIISHRRYWEDSDATFPKIQGELDNRPGKGRFERLTHDVYSYHSVTVSLSNRYFLLVRCSYLRSILTWMSRYQDCWYSRRQRRTARTPGLLHQAHRLRHRSQGRSQSFPVTLTLDRVEDREGTSYWIPESISVDDKQVALTMYHGHSYRPLLWPR